MDNISALQTTLRVNLTRTVDDSYPIYIGDGLSAKLGQLLADLPLGRRVAVVSDGTVFSLHGAAVLSALSAAGFDVAVEAVIPAGEASKTRGTKAWIEDRLLEANLGRDAWILALGGGVVGDMAGFTAATYLRGIPYVQLPTTLLAMVDSSVGGKTGLDTPQGKNLVGAFWQPKAVIADLALLNTLPMAEYRAGLAEVLKHAIIADAALFERLESGWEAVAAKDHGLLAEIVERNCAIKASVVERDEREGDLRKILNYGHTIGHAVEAAAEFELLHGDCVGIGMRYEGQIARHLGLWSPADCERADALLAKAGFLIPDKVNVDSSELIRLTHQDKKAREGKVDYVFPSAIGAMHRGERGYGVRVDDDVALSLVEKLRGR